MQTAIGPMLAVCHSFMLEGFVLQMYVTSYEHRHATIMKVLPTAQIVGSLLDANSIQLRFHD